MTWCLISQDTTTMGEKHTENFVSHVNDELASRL